MFMIVSKRRQIETNQGSIIYQAFVIKVCINAQTYILCIEMSLFEYTKDFEWKLLPSNSKKFIASYQHNFT